MHCNEMFTGLKLYFVVDVHHHFNCTGPLLAGPVIHMRGCRFRDCSPDCTQQNGCPTFQVDMQPGMLAWRAVSINADTADRFWRESHFLSIAGFHFHVTGNDINHSELLLQHSPNALQL